MIRLNPLGIIFELRNSRPDVDQDMSSRRGRAMEDGNYGDPIVSSFKRRDLYSTQASRHQVAADKRQTCRKKHSDNINNALYTLVHGVTGHIDGKTSLEPFPSLDGPFI